MFKGMLVANDGGDYCVAVAELDEQALPEGDVTVRVEYSTLNYKDALALTGKAPVVRRFPMVPGIDLAGVVERSDTPAYSPGDAVLLNGWGAGETHWGGFAQKARVRGEWLIPLPPGLDALQVMTIGTAGYTAMLCVAALERHGVTPADGEILVTGATGGVGGVAVLILSRLGYDVVAVSGKRDAKEHVERLGAKSLLDASLFAAPGKPLAKERWAAAIDVVGGHTLANVCAATKYRGIVACCGNAAGMDFPGSVAPFILRGVTLAGVDSVMCPRAERLEAWWRLAALLPMEKLAEVRTIAGLTELMPIAADMIDGARRGRVVVDVNR